MGYELTVALDHSTLMSHSSKHTMPYNQRLLSKHDPNSLGSSVSVTNDKRVLPYTWDVAEDSLHLVHLQQGPFLLRLTCSHNKRVLIVPGELAPVSSSVIFGHLKTMSLIRSRLLREEIFYRAPFQPIFLALSMDVGNNAS